MKQFINIATQFLLPVFTLSGQFATASGYPEWGLILYMIAQPFWLYSSWKAFKQAKQIGILINSVAFALITAWGIINYWF